MECEYAISAGQRLFAVCIDSAAFLSLNLCHQLFLFFWLPYFFILSFHFSLFGKLFTAIIPCRCLSDGSWWSMQFHMTLMSIFKWQNDFRFDSKDSILPNVAAAELRLSWRSPIRYSNSWLASSQLSMSARTAYICQIQVLLSSTW